MTSKGDAQFNLKQINEKLGQGKIIGTCQTDPDADDYDYSFGLIVQHEDGEKFLAWIQCDPEGNGPGFLSIEEAE